MLVKIITLLVLGFSLAAGLNAAHRENDLPNVVSTEEFDNSETDAATRVFSSASSLGNIGRERCRKAATMALESNPRKLHPNKQVEKTLEEW
jgi:hypothetical protein